VARVIASAAKQSRATRAALDRFGGLKPAVARAASEGGSLLAMTPCYSAATASGTGRATRRGMSSQNMATTADTKAKAASA